MIINQTASENKKIEKKCWATWKLVCYNLVCNYYVSGDFQLRWDFIKILYYFKRIITVYDLSEEPGFSEDIFSEWVPTAFLGSTAFLTFKIPTLLK